jgi:hypothetical protein
MNTNLGLGKVSFLQQTSFIQVDSLKGLTPMLTRAVGGYIATKWSVTRATSDSISKRFARGLFIYVLEQTPSQLVEKMKEVSIGCLFSL